MGRLPAGGDPTVRSIWSRQASNIIGNKFRIFVGLLLSAAVWLLAGLLGSVGRNVVDLSIAATIGIWISVAVPPYEASQSLRMVNQRMHRTASLCLSIFAMGVALFLLGSGPMVPRLEFFVAIGVISIAVGALALSSTTTRDASVLLIVLAILAFVLNPLTIMRYPRYHGGADSIFHESLTTAILQQGSVPEQGFEAAQYTSTPGFHLATAVLSVASGLSAFEAILLWALLSFVVSVAFVFLIARALQLSLPLALLAAVVFVFLRSTLEWTRFAIPATFLLGLIAAVIFLSTKRSLAQRRISIVLRCVIFAAMLISHTATPAITAVLLGIWLASKLVSRRRWSLEDSRSLHFLAFALIAFTAYQVFFLSTAFGGRIGIILGFIDRVAISSPGAAPVAEGNWIDNLILRVPFSVTILILASMGVSLITDWKRTRVFLPVIATGSITALTGFHEIPFLRAALDALLIIRWNLPAGIFFSIIAAMVILSLYRRMAPRPRFVLILVLLCVAITTSSTANRSAMSVTDARYGFMTEYFSEADLVMVDWFGRSAHSQEVYTDSVLTMAGTHLMTTSEFQYYTNDPCHPPAGALIAVRAQENSERGLLIRHGPYATAVETIDVGTLELYGNRAFDASTSIVVSASGCDRYGLL